MESAVDYPKGWEPLMERVKAASAHRINELYSIREIVPLPEGWELLPSNDARIHIGKWDSEGNQLALASMDLSWKRKWTLSLEHVQVAQSKNHYDEATWRQTFVSDFFQAIERLQPKNTA